jgi:hypothetical protein
MPSSAFRLSWPTCPSFNVSTYVCLNLILFDFDSLRPLAAQFESAPLAPDRARPLAGNDPRLREIFFTSLCTAV